MQALVSVLAERHYVYPPASSASLEHLRNLGLPEDVLLFYALSNGAYLNEGSEHDWNVEVGGRRWKWIILSAEEIKPITEIGFDLSNSPLLAKQKYWFPIIDVMDGNYLSINTAPGNRGEIIDCFHESLRCPGFNFIVARSFSAILQMLLEHKDCFWLQEKHRKNGAY